MTAPVVETSGLRKEYRSLRGGPVVAVDDLDLVVEAGGVHGLLGPDGSGKTTTLRLLLGLARATRGEMRLLGDAVPRRLPSVVSRVGAVVDHPGFLPSATGRRNLRLLAASVGVADSEVAGLLERVGLQGREDVAYRAYTPGMRQRLAIASTLLRSPELVVLDEPTRGLDPTAVRGVRTVVRELAASGVTVLVTSHVLAEVQQVCDTVSILDSGRLVSSGAVEDLIGRAPAPGVRVGVDRVHEAITHLTGAGFRVLPEQDGLLYVESAADPARVTEVLAAHGLFVRELVPDRRDGPEATVAAPRSPDSPSTPPEGS